MLFIKNIIVLLKHEYLMIPILGQVFGKNLLNHLKGRICQSNFSTLPKTHVEDVLSSYEGKFFYILS